MQSTDPFLTALQDWVGAFMHRSMRDFIRFAKDSGLSMSQMGALFHIRKGASGVSDIADDLGVTSAAASQMLERLVQSGLVIRSEDPNDRRVKQIVLTEKGQKTLKAGIQARESWMEDLLKMLTPEEKDQVAGALNILIEKTKLLERDPN
jgi:DNA-binding MarR family transcriptional regulator